MRVEELFKFMNERYMVYDRKRRGQPKPWTKDEILQRYRFCNVYREYDTQTRWLASTWRRDHQDFWFVALVFRFINWHETAQELGYPIPWSPESFIKVLKRRKKQGKKVYSGAYMISTHGVKEPKDTYLAKSLTKIWEARAEIRYRKGETLAEFHARLEGCFDVGSFIAGQVIADAKYIGVMTQAPDWRTFACSGPGSKRGLNRVLGLELDSPWKEMDWRHYLSHLHKEITPLIEKAKMPPLHAQDLQNCLCEFDKYERVRLGEGRPRSTYPGEK